MLALLRLFRVSAAVTPAADVFLGYALAVSAGIAATGWAVLAAGCAVSGLIFSSAVALNDVIDRRKDAREAPHRPLPAGRLTVKAASAASAAAAAAALLVAAAIGPAPAVAAAVVLALAVLYNTAGRWIRWVGVVNLGLVRAADVLLGMTLAAGADLPAVLGREPGLLALPALYAFYAVSLSGVALAERERRPSRGRTAAFALAASVAALLFAASPFLPVSRASGGLRAGATEPVPLLVIVKVLLFLGLLIFPLVRYLASLRPAAPWRPPDRLVGHLVSGYLLLAAMPVAVLLPGPAAWILAAAFLLSRALARLIPPA